MVRRIVWSKRARKNKSDILEYYFNRNKSKAYSRKLNSIIRKELELISCFPFIGKGTSIDNIRIKVTGHYYIIYEISEETIEVLQIWDSRQDPIKLKLQ